MSVKDWMEGAVKSLESLPVELQRNFELMRDLDGRTQTIMQDIDTLGDEFLRSSSTSSNERKRELTAKIQKMFNKAKEYGDDKVQLAIQTYDLVDKHIRRLDSDLARFVSDTKNGTVAGALSPQIDNTPLATNKRGRKRDKESLKKIKGVEIEKKGSKGGGSSHVRKKHKSALQLVAEQVGAGANGGSGVVLDMPVDPNEPTYCICHQVSFGNMIACDNPECPIEWFHVTCMGLRYIPKGKWYCPKCQPLRKIRSTRFNLI